MQHELSEQEIIRRSSLDQLKALNINPFPADEYKVTHMSDQIKKSFVDDSDFAEVCLAGRMMSRRIMGKASFAELQDASGVIQVYINRDELCPEEDKTMYNTVFKKLLDRGDFIGVVGKVFRTKVGELSINVSKLTVLSKSLRPLPVVKTDDDGKVHDAFTDPELRYRQRYVDLVVNPSVKETFLARTKVINTMRSFFNEKDYLEVETPILQPIPGGASARPFATHHNALDMPLYMRVANELYLKRLIVGGFDGVYEFAKDFRNEGMDKTHNPEFTVMEIYVAYKDYNWMMNFTEEMIEKVAMAVHGKTELPVGNKLINFQRPYARVTMYEAIKEHTGFDINGMNEIQLRDVCKQLNITVDETMGKGKLIDEIFGEKCERKYIQPTFITDYPIEMSPLCKKHRTNDELTERFELMINGKEVANAYSELNDPIDQLNRFQEQLKLSEKGDDEAMFIDMDFVRALEYGMPPTSGMGIGIDRLVMLMTNNSSIQEVLFFPQMRPENIKKEEISTPAEFEAIGVPANWVPIIIEMGLKTIALLKDAKATQIHQTLNGLRKKKKLDMPALQLDEILTWQQA
jgi:lysyl-tRNA synthetase class 2